MSVPAQLARRNAAPLMLLVLVASLLPGCGGSQLQQLRELRHEVAQVERQVAEQEAAVIAIRTETGQLDAALEKTLASLSDKLRRRIPGDDHLYAELRMEPLVEQVRSMMEGLRGQGEAGGQPYSWVLQGVQARSHRERFFVQATYKVTWGGEACAGPTSGYVLHLDRELLKLQELPLSCKASTGELALVLSDVLAPLPLPIGVLRRVEWGSPPGAGTERSADAPPASGSGSPPGAGTEKLAEASLELVTPLQVTLSPDRLILGARSVSLRRGAP